MTSIHHTYRIFAFFMAFMILFTSVGYTVDMHFCSGKLKSFSIFGKAKNCQQLAEKGKAVYCPVHKKMMVMPATEACGMDKKGCCSDKTLHFQFDQEQDVFPGPLALHPPLQYFLTAFTCVFLDNQEPEATQTDFICYKPPLIPRDIYVLNETFLL